MTSPFVSISGIEKIAAYLDAAGPNAMKYCGMALYSAGQDMMTESKKIVPFDTGVLAASGEVSMPKTDGASVTVELTYGGAAQAYTVYQHENLELKHADGRESKFLEKPVTRAQDRLARGLVIRLANIFRLG